MVNGLLLHSTFFFFFCTVTVPKVPKCLTMACHSPIHSHTRTPITAVFEKGTSINFLQIQLKCKRNPNVDFLHNMRIKWKSSHQTCLFCRLLVLFIIDCVSHLCMRVYVIGLWIASALMCTRWCLCPSVVEAEKKVEEEAEEEERHRGLQWLIDPGITGGFSNGAATAGGWKGWVGVQTGVDAPAGSPGGLPAELCGQHNTHSTVLLWDLSTNLYQLGLCKPAWAWNSLIPFHGIAFIFSPFQANDSECMKGGGGRVLWRRAVDELLMLPCDKKKSKRWGGFVRHGAFFCRCCSTCPAQEHLGSGQEVNSRHLSRRAGLEKDGYDFHSCPVAN